MKKKKFSEAQMAVMVWFAGAMAMLLFAISRLFILAFPAIVDVYLFVLASFAIFIFLPLLLGLLILLFFFNSVG